MYLSNLFWRPVYEKRIIQDMVVILKGTHLVALIAKQISDSLKCYQFRESLPYWLIHCRFARLLLKAFFKPGPSCQSAPPKWASHHKLAPDIKCQKVLQPAKGPIKQMQGYHQQELVLIFWICGMVVPRLCQCRLAPSDCMAFLFSLLHCKIIWAFCWCLHSLSKILV